MVTFDPQPDGRVAISTDGVYRGRARDQAHADDWAVRWEANQPGMAELAWKLADIFWEGMTPEERRAYSQPEPEIERAA